MTEEIGDDITLPLRAGGAFLEELMLSAKSRVAWCRVLKVSIYSDIEIVDRYRKGLLG